MYRFSLILLALIVPAASAAEPKSDAETVAKNLAPFVDEHSFIIARMDLKRFDVASFFVLFEPLYQIDAEQKTAFRATVKAWQDSFVKKGGREIYVVYGANDFPHQPCLLTPIGESPPERKDLVELLQMALGGHETSWVNINGFLCVGTKAAITRLKERKPAKRSDIEEALASVGDSPCYLVFAPSLVTRKVFEEISPMLPASIGGGSVQVLTRGLKWISISGGTAPKFPTRVIVQAKDAESAKSLQALLVKSAETGKTLLNSVAPKERQALQKLYERAVMLLTPEIQRDQLIINQELGAAVPELMNLIKDVQPAARALSSNNLKQICLALHNYADTYGRFPTNIKGKDGKDLLSWRVAILPYIEQEKLYRQFKMDEPWDSENNKKLISQMPKTYRSPKQKADLKDRTTYLAPLGKGLMWDDPKGVRFQDIADGTSNTIIVVESDDDAAAVWTKPDDIVIDMKNPTKGLLGHYDAGFLVAMADGSVRLVDKNYSSIWFMFTKAGGEVLPEK